MYKKTKKSMQCKSKGDFITNLQRILNLSIYHRFCFDFHALSLEGHSSSDIFYATPINTYK